jgi:peptide deformylase
MVRLKIVSVGEPVLRATSQEVSKEQILTPSIKGLIEYMRETIRDAPGVGLAAPQVGESFQLVVIEDKVEYQVNLTEAELIERERRPVPFHVLINPKIQLLAPSDTTFFEGCLSLPGFMAMVPRARRVSVEALDHLGEPVHIEAEGWYARILQHEIDHLRGTLYIDRMWSRSFCSLNGYSRHWKSKPIMELVSEFGPPCEHIRPIS